MAQWIRTSEPYIKVQEQIRQVALNPVAGEDLIIGVVLISDAGPAAPTLISNQSEFLATYTSQDVTRDYLASLNMLYSGDDSTLASRMWANGYRLAGSNTLLVVRASKAKDTFFAKPLQKDDQNTYVLRDGELLKSLPKVKLVLDVNGMSASHEGTGWAINISGVGIFGNLTTDEGAQYDYYVNNLVDLVESLNESSKFYSPSFEFFTDAAAQEKIDVNSDSSDADKAKVVSVVFNELYLGSYVLDTSDQRVPDGLAMMNFCTGGSYTADTIIDINGAAWSGFEPAEFYAINANNSATTLRVRIRRFNHDAVVQKELADSEVSSLTESGKSPYTVLTDVLDTFTQKGTVEPSDSIKARDFFEIAVWDPSVNSEVSFFNIGNITGRGDMEVSEVNSLIQMIQVSLPDDLHDLGLNYYDYVEDDKKTVYVWEEAELPAGASAERKTTLPTASEAWVGKYVTIDNGETYFTCVSNEDQPNGAGQLYANLTIDPTESSILDISDSDLKKALDEIVLDEVYTVEGLSDLGNTELSFQNYMANVAINSNYFYPISTANSTNYMTIGNQATKIPQDSYKLYMSAPWDIDSGTLGWKYYASPSVLYWEAVARNRRNNEEFASILGSRYGVVQYSRPVTEFNKKQRELLLSKRVNTVLWNVPTQAWNMNDCFTKTSQNNIMNEDGNSRLGIRIGKAIPILLRQFIGRKINQKMCDEMLSVLEYWFKTTILPMGITVDAYQIFVPYKEELARQNKQQVTVNVRFARSLKYVNVYEDYYDVGMDVSTDYHNL